MFTGYLTQFFNGSEQFSTVLSVLTVWTAISAIGMVVAGRDHISETSFVSGWAAVVVAFTAAGVFARLPFTVVAIGIAAAAGASVVVAWGRHGRLLPPGFWKAVALAIPLVLLVSAMVPSQWDEFSHWLPSQRFLLDADDFPRQSNPDTGATFPAYPYGWPFLTYLASKVAGRFVENAGNLFNVLLLLAFGLLIVRVMRMALDPAAGKGDGSPRWSLVAVGALAVTALNPSFVQKVVFTAYADIATAAAVGFGAVLGWLMLEAEASGDRQRARACAWQAGLALLVLVSLKQATFALFISVAAGIALAGLRDPAIRLADLARSMALVLAPPLAAYALWRYHVNTELATKEMGLRPLSEWLFELVPDILARMALIASKKGIFFALAVIAVVAAFRGLVRCRGSFDRLAIVTGTVILGYELFLFVSYVAIFGSYDALRAASFWRYNLHLGLLIVAFAAFGAARLWARFIGDRIDPRKVVWVPIVATLALPIAFPDKVRFDRDGSVPYYRMVASRLAPLLPTGSRIVVFDPTGSGESAMVTKYYIGRHAAVVGYKALYDDLSVANLKATLDNTDPNRVLVHSAHENVSRALGVDFESGKSYLLEPKDGRWAVVETWQR
ncbi:MAG: hypothetical protein EXQ86_10775 [Rhodospirillales bacterium]|nr:hypothetical protein [Rhodospirillales bacterium]